MSELRVMWMDGSDCGWLHGLTDCLAAQAGAAGGA